LKETRRFPGFIVSTAIIALIMTALSLMGCPDPDDDNNNNSAAKISSDFQAWLDTKNTNTVATAYTYTLQITNSNYLLSIRDVLVDNKNANKYVILDLTGSVIESIPDRAFRYFLDLGMGIGFYMGCTTLAGIIIPDGVTSIGKEAFSNCINLTSITIPNSVTSIEYASFQLCTGLTSITIPDNVTSIGARAFSNCTSLTSITIPNSVTSVGEQAFYVCTSLKSVTIGNNVNNIEEFAFAYCDSLTSVTFQGTISSSGLHEKAFGYYIFDGGYIGDLRDKYLEGGIGIYTREDGGTTWTKQP